MRFRTLFINGLILLLANAGQAVETRIVSGVTFSDTVRVVDVTLGELPLLRVVRGSESCLLYELQEGYPVVYDGLADVVYYAGYGTRQARWGALVSSGLPLADGLPPEGVWPGATNRGDYREWLESRRLDSRDWHYQVSGDYRITIVPIAPLDAPAWYGFNVGSVTPAFHQILFSNGIIVNPEYADGETNELTVRDHFLWAGDNGNGGINVIPDELRGEYDPAHPGWIAEGWEGNVPDPLLVPVNLADLDSYNTEGILELITPRIEELGFSTATDSYNVFLLLWGLPAADAGGWAQPTGVEESHLSASIWTNHLLLSTGEICRMIFGTLGYGELDPLLNDIGRAHLLCEGWQGPPRPEGVTYWQPAWVDPYIEQCLGWWQPELVEPGEDCTVDFQEEYRVLLPDQWDPEHFRSITLFNQSENFYKGHRSDACSYLCDITLSSWNFQYSIQSIPAEDADLGSNYAFPWGEVDSYDFTPWEEERPHPHILRNITELPEGGAMDIIWLGVPPLALQVEECTIDLNGYAMVELWNYGYGGGTLLAWLETGGVTGVGVFAIEGGTATACILSGLPTAPVSQLGELLTCNLTIQNTMGDTLLQQEVTAGRTIPREQEISLSRFWDGIYSSAQGSALWQWNMYAVVQHGSEVLSGMLNHYGQVEQAWVSQTAPLLVIHSASNWRNYWDIVDIETGSGLQIAFEDLGEVGFELGDQLVLFVEAVGNPDQSWICRHNLSEGTSNLTGQLPLMPQSGCALENEQLHLLALTSSERLIICNFNGTLLLDWWGSDGDLAQPLAADLNWDGWYDVLLPSDDGWHVFYFDVASMSFEHYFHPEPGIHPESVLPIYNGQQVVVSAIGEDFLRIGSELLSPPIEGLTAVQSADVNDDGIYEYFITAAGKGSGLITETGESFYGDYLPWLLHNLDQSARMRFHDLEGVNPRMIAHFEELMTVYDLGSDFSILWNDRGNRGNNYAHPLTAAVPQPPPHLDLEIVRGQDGLPRLLLAPTPGGHVLNGFQVYRSDNPYEFNSEPVALLGPCAEHWVDTDPQPDAGYYRVTMLLDDPGGLICPQRW